MNLLNNNFVKSILAIAFVVVLAWASFLRFVLSDIETITYDWRAKIATEKYNLSRHDPDIVMVAADDATTKILEKYPDVDPGRWPWRRSVWGDVVNFISKGEPKAIVFDLKFEGAGNAVSDKYFADSIKGKNVVIGTALSHPRTNEAVEKILAQKYRNTLNKKTNKTADKFISAKYIEIFGENTLDKKFALIADHDLYRDSNYGNKYARAFLDNITFYQSASIFDELINNTDHIGVINLHGSENTVFRHHVPLYKLVDSKKENYLPSLPLATVLSVLPEEEKKPFIITKAKIIIGKRVIPIDSSGKLLINWHGPGMTYETIPVGRVIVSNALQKGKITSIKELDKISPEYFKDKIVVIGQTSAGTDIHPTPMASVYPGPEIITTVIDNLLNDADITNPGRRKFILKSSPEIDILLTFVLCLIIGYTMSRTKSNSIKFQVFIFAVMLYATLAICAFVHPMIRIWLNMTYPLIFMFITGISTYAYITYKENMERKEVELLFGKFVSPQILEKLLADKESTTFAGQRKVMTVLFSDIRGFTRMSEKHPPDVVISILNEYITEMVEVILSYNGTLDKYIGDAIMAFYNDPVEMRDHALKAVLTAKAMKEKLEELNTKWKAEGKETLSIGIGINTGEMIVGHMGSPRLLDYTVIGDNVNLASRIESLTKSYGVTILITESTYEQVKDEVETRFVNEVIVKGKTSSVKIYEVK